MSTTSAPPIGTNSTWQQFKQTWGGLHNFLMDGELIKGFHYDMPPMERIVEVHYPEIKKQLVSDAMDIFFDVRSVPGLKKKPSTSELIDWLKLLMADDIPDEILKNRDATKAIPPLYGALVKNEQDVHLLERLAFMHRRESRR